MRKQDQQTLISNTDTCLRSLACSKAYLTGNTLQAQSVVPPSLAFGSCMDNTAQWFLVSSKAGLSQKTYGECHGASKRWGQTTTGPGVHLWAHRQCTRWGPVSPFYDLIKMWMYTLQTPMNIYKQIVFREWLLWWKTSKKERQNTNFFFFALSYPSRRKVTGSLTCLNESLMNKTWFFPKSSYPIETGGLDLELSA